MGLAVAWRAQTCFARARFGYSPLRSANPSWAQWAETMGHCAAPRLCRSGPSRYWEVDNKRAAARRAGLVHFASRTSCTDWLRGRIRIRPRPEGAGKNRPKKARRPRVCVVGRGRSFPAAMGSSQPERMDLINGRLQWGNVMVRKKSPFIAACPCPGCARHPRSQRTLQNTAYLNSALRWSNQIRSWLLGWT